MLSLLVDPQLLILPQGSEAEFRQFAMGLLDWKSALARPDRDLFMSEACVAALMEERLYPWHDRAELLGDLPVPEVSWDLLYYVADALLHLTPKLEQRTGISYLLAGEQGPEVDPPVFVDRLPPSVGQALALGLATLAFWQQHVVPGEQESLFAAALRAGAEHGELTVSAEVQLVEGFPDPPPCQLPTTCMKHFRVCFDHLDADRQEGVLNLWGDAESPERACAAIELQVNELAAGGTLPHGQPLTFRFGPGFLASAQRCGFTTARGGLVGILVDSCARLVINRPKSEVKPFREDERPQSRQRRRPSDGALAFRTHLTEGKEGFRLMYWKVGDKCIEFTNVGPKWELKIE